MGCTVETPCTDAPCTCAVKDLSTDCVLYTGDNLECSGIEKDTILTNVIKSLDEFICNKFNDVIGYLSLISIGDGAMIFKGINGIGQKEIKSIVSEDLNLLDIVVNEDTVGLKPGVHGLVIEGNDIELHVVTDSGDTLLTTITLPAVEESEDTYVASGEYDVNNDRIILTLSDSSTVTIDTSELLGKYVSSGAYDEVNTKIVLTFNDSSSIDIDMSAVSGIQVNSDYLEADVNSKAHILNKNPSKTVALGVAGIYTVLVTDNNYIIEIDNGANDVSINFSGALGTDNYFVGFVQKGTGVVTFTDYDILPVGLTPELYGQGHVAALEILNSTKYLQGTLKPI